MKSVLKSADILGSSVHFNINGERNLTSNLGIILSFTIYLLMLTAMFMLGQELWQKNNPSVNSSYELEESPPGVPLDFKNFDIFVGIENKVSNVLYVDDQIYTVKASLFSYHKNETSSFFVSRDFNVEPCHENSFDQGSVMRKIYNKGGWCVSRNQSIDFSEIIVRGLYGKENFQMIQIFLEECRNSTKASNTNSNNNSNDNNNKNLFCKDKQTIEEQLNATTITINVIDNFVRTSNYQNPTSQRVANYFFHVSKNSFSSFTLYLKHLDFVSDSGLILSDSQEIKTFKNDYFLMGGSPNPPKDHFAGIYIQMIDIREKYFRRYYKIQDLFAQIGGLFKFFQMAAGLLMYRFNAFNFSSELIKMVFLMDKEVKDPVSKITSSNYIGKYKEKSKRVPFEPKKECLSDTDKVFERFDIHKLHKAYENDKEKEDIIKLENNDNNQVFKRSQGPIKKFSENSKLKESQNKLIVQNNYMLNSNKNNINNLSDSNNPHNSQGICQINHPTSRERIDLSVKANTKLNKFNLSFNFWEKLFMSRLCIRKSKISDFNSFLIGREILIDKLDIKTLLNDYLNMQKIKYLLLSKEKMASFEALPNACLGEHAEYDKYIINYGNNWNYDKLEKERFKFLENRISSIEK